jgi:hypothetical protein
MRRMMDAAPAQLGYEPRANLDRRRSRRRAVLATLIGVAVIVGGVLGPGVIARARLVTIRDRLNNPQPLWGWTGNSLDIGGTLVALARVDNVRPSALVLQEVQRQGVELSNGRVYGLVRVHHWCGHDRVQHHLARVDVEQLLIFAGEADATDPVIAELLRDAPGARFTLGAAGWDVSEYSAFRSFSGCVDQLAATRPIGNGTAPQSR